LKERLIAALLFISHDLSVVAQIAQRVAVMRKGKIVEIATCAQLFSNPQHPYTRSLLAAVPTMQSDRDKPLAVTGNSIAVLEGPLVEIASGHWSRRPE